MKKASVSGICKLCQKEKELIGRSHIWPDFMYNGMHDGKGRLYVINSENPGQHRFAQSGSYERFIFCKECDNVGLGRLERYASNHLYRKPYLVNGDEFKLITVAGGMEIIHCEHLEYNQFKHFLLSLLWRASISTEAMFENFKLTDEEEEFLRVSLYEESVVDEMVFPCVLMTTEGVAADENFIAVDPFRQGIVKFYINDFIYTFYLAENRKDQTTNELAIGMDHKMGIMKLSRNQWDQIRMSIIQGTLSASRNNGSKPSGQ